MHQVDVEVDDDLAARPQEALSQRMPVVRLGQIDGGHRFEPGRQVSRLLRRGVDRTVLALICEAYSEDEAPDEKGKMETRTVLRFHPRMAPIKCAVFPLLKNKELLVAKAKEIISLLRPHMFVFYDESGAIGRRYRRQDEIGTPFCVTVDFQTLGTGPLAVAEIPVAKGDLSELKIETPL